MNMFTVQLLQMLLKDGKTTIPEIIEQLHITRRMALYYQKQLNHFLKSSGLGETELRDECIYLQTSSTSNLLHILENLDIKQYYLEAEERQECILIKIGVSAKPQYLEDLAEEFRVSRRTLTNDLIYLKDVLQEYGIKLLSRQKQGYCLAGDELTIRYLILSAYHRRNNVCIDHIKKELILDAYRYYSPDHPDKIFEELRQILIDSETYCKEKFVYFSLPDLAQTILLICLRSKKQIIHLPAEEIPDFTPAIDYIEKQLEKLDLKPEGKERIYFWLVLQSAKITNYENSNIESVIEDLIEDIITEFRRISGLKLSRSSELFQMFALHVRSMYYRTRYRIKITELYNESVQTDQTFFCLTKKVMEKVGIKYHLTLDDGEIQFISYYFFCMSQQSDANTDTSKPKIIIVCVSGFGSSVYVRYQISRLLEQSFSVVISDLRNLDKVLDQNTRLIISTLEISPKYTKGVRVIKVSTILSSTQKKELIDWLLHEEGYLKHNGMISELLDIIKEHAVIQEQEKLFLRLNHYFRSELPEKKELHLSDLLHLDLIQTFEEANSWQEGLYLASLPLEKAGYIENSYIADMLHVIEEYGPYCEFVNGMLLAHAEPKNNVKYPVIGLAVFRKPIYVKEWAKEITAIFILGVTEQINHAAALSELVANLSDNETYLTLHNSCSADEIYRLLVKN